MKKINLVYLDPSGQLHTDPRLLAVGANGRQIEVADETWIDFPTGAELLSLPGRLPLGFDPVADELAVVDEEAGEPVTAVSAILPMGFTRTLLPGYELANEVELPLFGYTAVGAEGERLKVPALKTDSELKWNPAYYNTADLGRLIAQKRDIFPENRILRQLARCASEYHCLTAQNIFYQRWEAGIPVSPECNADCLGCISKQPAQCCPAPQSRIQFVPTVNEVVELAVEHLQAAPEAIISFGQGCEGEPSLQYRLLSDAIREIRNQTGRGTLNINSNAGNFQAVQQLVDAGLDSIRVSLFSALSDQYRWYHHPQGYGLEDVTRSIRYAADHGLMVSINLLFYPGITNQKAETEALYALLSKTGVNQVQLRNLNLDPEKLITRCGEADETCVTVREWLDSLKFKFPNLCIGNYSIPLR